MKFLIVNADDFGLSPGINRGIVETFENGIVTSTSIMANGPAFDDACSLALQTHIPVGLHLNLTFGSPVSSPERVPTLVDTDGRFYGKWTFIKRFFAGLIKRQEIETEIQKQIVQLLDHGILITHFDSHHHIHCLPGVDEICQRLASQLHIESIRRVTMPKVADWRLLSAYSSQMMIAGLQKKQSPKFREYNFWGFEFMASKNKKETLLRILASLPKGTNELMCHPGNVNENDAIGKYSNRREEIEALCQPSVKEFIRKNDIALISFRECS